jgi:hypothetical protein
VSVLIEDPTAIDSTHTDNTMFLRSDDSSDDDSQDGFETDCEDDSEDEIIDDYRDDRLETVKENRHTRTVIVRVGRHMYPFKVHTALLIEKSHYFRKTLKHGRCEKKLVRLAGVDKLSFKIYMHWVYRSELDYAALGYHPNGDDFVEFPAVLANGGYNPETHSNVSRHMEKTGDWAHRLMALWVHAEFLGDVGLQNTISEELEKWWFQTHHVVSIHRRTFEFVGRHTPPNSPLRKLCIDWAELSHVFRNRVGSQPEVERWPKWLLSELLLLRMCRERGTLVRDPRMMDLTQRGRYNVC